MIVSCEKCLKTFTLEDSLIPNEGRMLQCGNCNYKWFFEKQKTAIKQDNEIPKNLINNESIIPDKKISANSNKLLFDKKKIISTNLKADVNLKNVKKKPKIIKNTLVFIISLAAFIILLDTFKYQLNNYLPGLNSILNNLYESLKDISLFFRDLIN